MDTGTFAVILIVILALAVGAFFVLRNAAAAPPAAAAADEVQQISAPIERPQTETGATSSWMYPRGEFDSMTEAGRKSCVAAYSLHHLWSGYKGPVAKIRRLGDGKQENFYADSSAELRTTSNKTLKDWLKEYDGPAVPEIVIWYDQSGNNQHTEVERNTSPTRIERRDDGRREGWQIRFTGTDVIKIGAANRNNPLKDYADFTISLTAKWEDKPWATGLWIGQPGNDSSVRKSSVFIGNYSTSGRYSFIYGGNVDERQVVSTRQTPETMNSKEVPFTNFIMVAKSKSKSLTEIRGYIDGAGFNTNTAGVVYSGPPPNNIRADHDVLYLGGHSNMTGGAESRPIVGKVTDLILFATPLVSSDWTRMASYNN